MKIRFIFIITFSFLLFSCSSSNSNTDLKKFVKNLKAKKASPLRTLNKYKIEALSVVPADMQDPFYLDTPITNTAKDPVGKVKKVFIPILERYSTKRMSLVGVVKNDGNYWCLVKLPNNKTYSLAIGDKIGLNDGMIKEITPKKVIVSQKIKDSLGFSTEKLSEIVFLKPVNNNINNIRFRR